MKIKQFISSRSAGFYLGALAAVAALVSAAIYSAYCARNGTNVFTIVLFCLSFISAVVFCLRGTGVFPLLCAVFAAAGAGCFFCDTYGTYVDYFNQVNFWGDVTQLGTILAVMIVALVCAALSVAACFAGGITKNKGRAL